MTKVLSYAMVLALLPAVEAFAQQQINPAPAPASVPYPIESAESPLTRVTYTILTRTVRSAANPLDGLTPEQIAIVEKLNRVNAARLPRLSRVVVPATWIDDENAYRPFPQEYTWAVDKPKAIVVDQQAQAFAAYEYGRLVCWGPVSTGSAGQTPSGLFHLSWRSRGHASSIDPSWYLEWYFNFIPSRGIAFHKYSLPGQAASHGCVRLLERDAQWLFEWGDPASRGVTGTPVVVLGCPDPAKEWHAVSFLERGIALPDAPPAGVMSCTNYSGSTAATQRKTIR